MTHKATVSFYFINNTSHSHISRKSKTNNLQLCSYFFPSFLFNIQTISHNFYLSVYYEGKINKKNHTQHHERDMYHKKFIARNISHSNKEQNILCLLHFISHVHMSKAHSHIRNLVVTIHPFEIIKIYCSSSANKQ